MPPSCGLGLPEHLGGTTVSVDGEQGAVVAGASLPPMSWSGPRRRRATRRERSWRLMAERSRDVVEPRQLLGHLRLRTVGVQDEQVLVALLDEVPSAVARPPENGACLRPERVGASLTTDRGTALQASECRRAPRWAEVERSGRWPARRRRHRRAPGDRGIGSPLECAPGRSCRVRVCVRTCVEHALGHPCGGFPLEPPADPVVKLFVCCHHTVPFWATTCCRASA